MSVAQLAREFVEVVKSYIPDFSFGYLERIVPLYDISDSCVVSTELRYSAVYEILPRTLAGVEDFERIKSVFTSYAKEGFEVGFLVNITKGLEEDYKKHLSLFEGRGIFEIEAKEREELFKKARRRKYYVFFTSESKERLKGLELSSLPFTIVKRLDDNDIFNLFRCLLRDCGRYDFTKVLLSNLKKDGYASVRESIFPSEVELLDDCLKIGEFYALPFSVESLGDPSPLAVFETIEIPDDAFFVSAFRYLTKVEAEELLTSKLRAVKGLGFSETARRQKHLLEDLLSSLKLSDYDDPLCYFHFGGVLFEKDREKLKETGEKVKTALRSRGYSVYLHGDYVRELGENLVPKPRKLGFFNDAVSSVPAFTKFVGYERPVVVFGDKNGKDLIYFDPLSPESQSWGMCIFGPAGSGKSNLANVILKACKTLSAWIVVIDIGDSYRELCKFFEGEYVRITLDGKVKINPFQFRFGFTKAPKERIEFLVPFFEIILRHKFDPEEVSLLKRYFKFLYDEKLSRSEEFKEYLELLKGPYSEETERKAYEKFCQAMPTISDMLLEFEYLDAFRQTLEPREVELLDRIKTILKGLEGHPLFDGKTNFSLTNDFTVFELKELSGEEYRHYLEGFYLLLQRFVNEEVYYCEPDPTKVPRSLLEFYGEEELTRRWKRYKVFLTDEFHFVRNSKLIMEDTAFAYATGRKKNLVRIIVSQFLTDLESQGEDVFTRIIDNTAVIFLASHRRETITQDAIKGYEDAIKKTAERLHFSESELREFKNLRRGKDFADYYMVSRDKGRVPVRYKNTKVEKWMFATYAKDVVLRDTLIRKFGRDKAYELLLTKEREELERLAEEG